MYNIIEIKDEGAFRKPYGAEDGDRYHLKISLTNEFMEDLRRVITVGKGGQTSGFMETAAEIMLLMLSEDIDEEDTAKVLEDAVMRFHHAYKGDMETMYKIASSLEVIAYAFRESDKLHEIELKKIREEKAKKSEWHKRQLEQEKETRTVEDLIRPYG